MTSIHAIFGRKAAQILDPVKGTFFNWNANKLHGRCEITSSRSWLSQVFFKIVGLWAPKIQKVIFPKNCPQNPKFSNFSKDRNIYVKSVPTTVPIFNRISQNLTPKSYIFLPIIVTNEDVIISIAFLGVLDYVRKKNECYHWIPEAILRLIDTFCV